MGTYQCSIRGTSGTIVHEVPITLVVQQAPSLGLTATPASVTIAAGNSGTVTLDAKRTAATGDVTLTAPINTGSLGLTFPATISGTSAPLKIDVPASTAPGPYTIGMVGTLGALTASAAITVQVTAAGCFTLSTSPA